MKIFDCFKFFNELELLELRFMELYDTVDYFVLVEANKTHTGKPKNYIFEENKEKFTQYLDKVIHIKIDDMPSYSEQDIWTAENFQRNCIMRGLVDYAKNGDKIIISDIDEIPNTDIIKSLGKRIISMDRGKITKDEPMEHQPTHEKKQKKE